jgi:hypothetical protein
VNSFVRCPRTGRACSEGACRERHWCRQLFERGLSHRGLPLKRKFRPRCCAKTRAGVPCIMRVLPGKRRCRFHGGLSTGPKTKAGRARIAEVQRRRWKAFRGVMFSGLPPKADLRSIMRVLPGKRRCRFHGGLSTGPKTKAGRARITEVQRRRWKAFRGVMFSGLPPKADLRSARYVTVDGSRKTPPPPGLPWCRSCAGHRSCNRFPAL